MFSAVSSFLFQKKIAKKIQEALKILKILIFLQKNSKKQVIFIILFFFYMWFIVILLAIDCEKHLRIDPKMHPGEPNNVRIVPQTVLLSSASMKHITNNFISPMNSLGRIYVMHEVSRNLKNYFFNAMFTVRSLEMYFDQPSNITI